ncbi:MAG: hypothetical protein WA761_10325 [Thermoplasmata archaeon]
MSGRPATGTGPPTFRVEILKELEQLLDNREARDRLDRGPLAETKGREHWLLHLLLRADELQQSHLDALVGSAYSNLAARLEAISDRLDRLENLGTTTSTDTRTRLDSMDSGVAQRIDHGFEEGMGRIEGKLTDSLSQNLDQKWKPIGDSIETFSEGSRHMLRDISDTYRLVTQTRLLLNENARRITDLGRDIVALEESLKLVVARTLEEGLAPLEERVSALEGPRTIRPVPDADPEPEPDPRAAPQVEMPPAAPE